MKRAIGVVLVLAAVGIALLVRPLPTRELESRPAPTTNYEDALVRLAELQREDDAAIAPDCRTRWMTHGTRTGRIIVLLHGLTNCPAQFDSLGSLLFARGANVLIPRLPRHGFADKMTDDLARIGAAELCAFTDRVLDVANGLGDTVLVAGLSVSGTLAAWAGQSREDVDRAVAIAPLLGVPRVPAWVDAAILRLTLTLPNRFVWWDSKRREDLLGPEHVYPRFATRAIAASAWIGVVTIERARRAPPGARALAIVTVGGDASVDTAAVSQMVRAWRRHGVRDVQTYEFPRELELNHDVVDPEQVRGNPAITYPPLIALIDP